jgi:hypothetical protein
VPTTHTNVKNWKKQSRERQTPSAKEENKQIKRWFDEECANMNKEKNDARE